MEQAFCNGWAVLFLGLGGVVPKPLLRDLDADIMEEGGGNDDICITTWMIAHNAVGMVKNA